MGGGLRSVFNRAPGCCEKDAGVVAPVGGRFCLDRETPVGH